MTIVEITGGMLRAWARIRRPLAWRSGRLARIARPAGLPIDGVGVSTAS